MLPSYHPFKQHAPRYLVITPPHQASLFKQRVQAKIDEERQRAEGREAALMAQKDEVLGLLALSLALSLALALALARTPTLARRVRPSSARTLAAPSPTLGCGCHRPPGPPPCCRRAQRWRVPLGAARRY